MARKRIKNPILSLPSRQDLIIVGVSLLIGLLVFTYYAL
jgi:hypothetical protein